MNGDRLAGVVVLGVGLAAAFFAQGFPPATGQVIGPGVFPLLLGVGLAVIGALLVRGGGRGSLESSAGEEVARSVTSRPPRAWTGAVTVAVGLLSYAVVVTTMGFFITSTALLLALFAAFGVSWPRATTLALVMPIVLHVIFYSVLRVPLPWGVLERFAW